MSGITFNDNPQALFETSAPAQRRGSRTNTASDGTVLPEAQFWLNIGYMTQVPNKDDPSIVENTLVSIPGGIPLDTIKQRVTNTNSVELNNRNHAGNVLLEQILNMARQMEPGSTRELKGLTIEIRRVNDKAEPVADDQNLFLVGMPQL